MKAGWYLWTHLASGRLGWQPPTPSRYHLLPPCLTFRTLTHCSRKPGIFHLLTQSGVVVQRWGSKKVGRGSKGVGTYKSTAPAACSKDKIHIKHMKKMKNTNIFTIIGGSVQRWPMASSRCALMNNLCNH